MNVSLKELIKKILISMKSPIKVVQYGWVASPALNAGARILQNASPANSTSPSSEPSGYTFLCWLEFASTGWVGAPYGANPASRVTDIWSPTAKGGTTGVSIYGMALYIRSDLL